MVRVYSYSGSQDCSPGSSFTEGSGAICLSHSYLSLSSVVHANLLLTPFIEHPLNLLSKGNSRLSEDMFEDGFQSIANIDISKVCIAQMQAKYETF